MFFGSHSPQNFESYDRYWAMKKVMFDFLFEKVVVQRSAGLSWGV